METYQKARYSFDLLQKSVIKIHKGIDLPIVDAFISVKVFLSDEA